MELQLLKRETNGEYAERCSLHCFLAWMRDGSIPAPRDIDEANGVISKYLEFEREEILKRIKSKHKKASKKRA